MNISPLEDIPPTLSHKIRKYLMLQIWRVEQARSLITLFFWSFALSGIFYDKVAWRFKSIGLSPSKDVVLITLILTLFVVIGIVTFGFIYDRVLRMWEFKSRVITGKDIFRHGKMNDKEIKIYQELWYPLVKALNNIEKEGKLQSTLKTVERWVKNKEVIFYELEKEEKGAGER
ncbi:MAG TPA: hypothetical protein EYP29_05540 [Thermoplasmata archaeon]|nr:hypothetical protein [Thermoplasmata archaeon]